MTGSSDATAGASEVFDFVTLFLADQAEGKVRALDAYLPRFPGHEDAIAAEYRRLTEDEVHTEPTSIRRLGHYEILRRLGSGGQGAVLLAEDTRLNRRVALKILAPHLDFVSTDRLQRFRREAAILSQLDHPGICTVFEADTYDGVPFLAMRYVEGDTLAAIIRARRQARDLPRTRVALHTTMGWIESAARALHEAHEAGIIHRDVKPGNVMITPQGEPVLLDFGLARHEDAHDASITRTGEVLGTLAYMAPELLGSGRIEADRRADVYALGVSLYECLTNALPFCAETQTALWRCIESGDVVNPRNHNPAIPAELAAVILTAIARSPAHRYSTALELAEDLARVRRREPIKARQVPLQVRALRWVQRHPTLSLGFAATFLLIVVLVVSLQRVLSEERAASALNRALNASTSDEGAAAALADLLAAAGTSPRADLRSAIVQVLDACHLDWWFARTPLLVAHTDPEPALDPTESLLAVGDSAGFVEVRSAIDGHLYARRRAHTVALKAIAFADEGCLLTSAPDGIRAFAARDLHDLAEIRAVDPRGNGLSSVDCQAIAVDPRTKRVLIGGKGTILFLDRTDWSVVASVPLEPSGVVRRFEFSPDGRRLAVLGKDGGEDADGNNLLWLIDTQSGAVLHSHRVEPQEILYCTFDPTSSALALAHNGGAVAVHDATSFERLFALDAHQEVNWCGFDPTGALLLVPNDRGTDLWDWHKAATTPLRRLVHPSQRTIGAAAFDSTHKLLASVHRDGTVLIRATDDWRILRRFNQRMINVRFLRWLRDSGDLLTADNEKISSWLVGKRPHVPEFFGHRDSITSIAVDPDGTRFATGSLDGTARIWSLRGGTPTVVVDHAGLPVRHLRFAGQVLLTTSDDALLRCFDRKDGHLLSSLEGHRARIEDLVPLPVEDRVATIGTDGRCIVWDVAARRVLRELVVGEAPLRCIAVHPTRPWIAVGGADTFVTVWDWTTDHVMMHKAAIGLTVDWHTNPFFQVRGLAFDTVNDRLLASLVNVRLAQFSIAENWAPSSYDEQRYGGEACSAQGCPGVLCADYSFGCLTLLRGQEVIRLKVDGAEPHSNRITSVRIATGGGLALSAARDGQLFLWDLRTGEPVQAVRTSNPIFAAEFTSDGRFVITGSSDGTVKMWPTDPVTTARRYLAHREPGRTQGK